MFDSLVAGGYLSAICEARDQSQAFRLLHQSDRNHSGSLYFCFFGKTYGKKRCDVDVFQPVVFHANFSARLILFILGFSSYYYKIDFTKLVI